GGRAGIVDDQAGHSQSSRCARTAGRYRHATDRNGRRSRPHPVLYRRHHHPPARTRLLVRSGGRVPPAGRGRAGAGTACQGAWDVGAGDGVAGLQLIGDEINMTFYSLVLFVHVTAALALFAALTFEVLSLFHLRRASTLTEVHLWLDPVPRLPLAAMEIGRAHV